MSKQNKKESFVAYPINDNAENLMYTSRYLDALASFFAVQAPCAAIIFHEDKFFLSYNSDAQPDTKNKAREIEFLLNEKNNSELLARYLMFNVDFDSSIQRHISHNNAKLEQKLVETIKAFCQLIKKHRQELTDNCYSNTKINKISKIQYGDSEFTQEKISSIQDELEVIINPIKNVALNKVDYLNDVRETYFNILETLKSKTGKDIELNQLFIRPLQDVEKVLNFLSNSGVKIEINILYNKENLHTEVNIAQKFPCLKDVYVGISRLSCAPCHETLELYNYAHRGTHGICDDWKPPAKQFENIVKRLEENKAVTDLVQQLYMQHRRLSIDTSDGINEQEIQYLWQAKTALGLIQDESLIGDYNISDEQ